MARLVSRDLSRSHGLGKYDRNPELTLDLDPEDDPEADEELEELRAPQRRRKLKHAKPSHK